MNEEIKPTVYESFGIDADQLSRAKPVEDVAKILNMNPDRLRELASKRLCPHIRIDNGEPMFHMAKIREWVAKNLTEVCDGVDLPLISITQVINSSDDARISEVPESIAGIEGLKVATLTTLCSGIYFLCHENEVVYVGQAANVAARVGHHTDKIFDRVYFKYAHLNALSNLEHELIVALLPKYNKCAASQKRRRELNINSDALTSTQGTTWRGR